MWFKMSSFGLEELYILSEGSFASFIRIFSQHYKDNERVIINSSMKQVNLKILQLQAHTG